MYCKKCGNTLSENDRFCRKCGEPSWFFATPAEPTVVPEVKPVVEPTVVHEVKPVVEPTVVPEVEVTAEPAAMPEVKSVVEPTVVPEVKVTAEPAAMPEVKPVVEPMVVPEVKPVVEPTVVPEARVTAEPAAMPEVKPAVEPTVKPVGAVPVGSVEADAKAAFDFLDSMFQDLKFSGVADTATVAATSTAIGTPTWSTSSTTVGAATGAAHSAHSTADEALSGTFTLNDIAERAGIDVEANTFRDPDDDIEFAASAFGDDAQTDEFGTADGVGGLDGAARTADSGDVGATNGDANADGDATGDAGTDGTDDAATRGTAQTAVKPKKNRLLKAIIGIGIVAIILAIATWVFLDQWVKTFQENKTEQNQGPAAPTGTSSTTANHPGASGSVNPLDVMGDDGDIMQASIEVYKGNGPNIKAIETLYDLKFTEDREYGLDGLNKAILFDDDMWYMNDLMENIHYTPEIVRTIIEYFSTLVDRMNTGSKDVLSYMHEGSDLYKEIEAIKGKENGKHVIEKMQIGEMRRSGDDFYILVNLTESDGPGSPTTETVKAVHLFARPKVLEVLQVKEPVDKASAEPKEGQADQAEGENKPEEGNQAEGENKTEDGDKSEDNKSEGEDKPEEGNQAEGDNKSEDGDKSEGENKPEEGNQSEDTDKSEDAEKNEG